MNFEDLVKPLVLLAALVGWVSRSLPIRFRGRDRVIRPRSEDLPAPGATGLPLNAEGTGARQIPEVRPLRKLRPKPVPSGRSVDHRRCTAPAHRTPALMLKRSCNFEREAHRARAPIGPTSPAMGEKVCGSGTLRSEAHPGTGASYRPPEQRQEPSP